MSLNQQVRFLFLACSIVFAAAVNADEPKAASASVQKAVTAGLTKHAPDLKVADIFSTPIKGIYEVHIENGPLLYAAKDGLHFFVGDLYKVTEKGMANLTEIQRGLARKELLDTVKPKDMIIYPPEGDVKSRITVFTDIDCGYCRKLHQEVPALNKLGIEVRYLAFPRAGAKSGSADKLATAWCAKDPNKTLTQLKNNESVPIKTCDNHPIASHFALGGDLGVRATPTLILDDGQIISGYRPAADLAKELGVSAN